MNTDDAVKGLDLNQTTAAVALHLKAMDDSAEEFLWWESAYEGFFWRNSPFGEMPKVPTKFETNMIWPFIAAHLSNLYYRAPRTKVRPPALVVGSGRPADPADTSTLEALLDDWLIRAEVKEQVSYAYQLALMFGMAAFKLCVDEDGDALSRIRVDVVPRWECLWDERATVNQQTYRGHLRYELVSTAEEIVGVPLRNVEGIRPVSLPGWMDKIDRTESDLREESELDLYVHLLEFYDFEADQLRFYIVDGGNGGTPRLVQVGKALPMPWPTPDGRGGVPMIPVVLANKPNLPMSGIPAVRRIYQHNAETNLMLSIVASKMREDAGDVTAYKPEAFDKEFNEAVSSGDLSRWVKVKDSVGPLDALWATVPKSKFAESLPMYKGWVESARQDAQGFSDIMTGRQGKYLSATEAELLAGAGEATATEIASRMAAVVGKVCELFLSILRETAGGSIRIQRGSEVVTVDRKLLDRSYSVELQDSASTPVRDGQKKTEIQQIQGPLMELVKLAAPAPAPPAVPGQPAQPVPQLAGEVRAAAAALVDYIVTLYQLPEALKWASLQQRAELFVEEPPEPQNSQPAEGERLPIDRSQAEALLARVQEAQGGMP